MDKELALAIDFKKAPADLQAAATDHYTNVKALAKAQAKVITDQNAVVEAQRVYEESAKVLRVALKNWTPEV
jgi:hypothetical protein